MGVQGTVGKKNRRNLIIAIVSAAFLIYLILLANILNSCATSIAKSNLAVATKPNAIQTMNPAITPQKVDYIDFFNHYDPEDQGRWLEITGRVYSKAKNTIEISGGQSKSIRMNFNDASDITHIHAGDIVAIIGQVGMKTANMLEFDNCSMKYTGNEAKKANDEQVKSRIDKKHGEAIDIDLAALINEFHNNALTADNKYNDKLIVVTGTVYLTSTDYATNTPYILLKDNNQSLSGYIRCNVDNQDMIDVVSGLTYGDRLTVVGTCIGKTMGYLTFEDCYVRLPAD